MKKNNKNGMNNKISLYMIILLFIICLTNNCTIKSQRKIKSKEAAVMYNNPETTISIPKLIKEKSILYSEICDTVIHIPLETNKNCLIGNINKIEVYDSLIFVGDYNQTKSIFIFDKTGNFVRKLHNYGKGPGEYIAIDEFNVDFPNKKIYINDRRQKKILVYDFNFNFIKSKSFNYFYRNVFGFNNGLYLYQNSARNASSKLYYQFLVYDDFDSKRINEKFLPFTEKDKYELFSYQHFRNFNNEKLFFRQSLSNRILSYCKKEKLKYAFDIQFHPDDKAFVMEENIGLTVDEAFDKLIKEDLSYIEGFDISEDFMYFKIQKGVEHYFCLYNCKTGDIKAGDYFMNDLPYSFVIGVLEEIYKNYLVSYIEPIFIKSKMSPKLREKIFPQIKNFSNANPIIIMSRLKLN